MDSRIEIKSDWNIFFFLMLFSKLKTGRWHVKNIKPTANGEPQEVKIKVRLNANGVILVTSANLVDKKKAEEIAADNGNAGDANNMDVAQEVCNIMIGFIRNLQFDFHLFYF